MKDMKKQGEIVDSQTARKAIGTATATMYKKRISKL